MDDFERLLSQPALLVAPRLLGCELVRELGAERLCLRIVEVEAYNQSDAASHSYKGVTPRTSIMFGPAGYLYVYFSYGLHYCCNIVTGLAGQGEAVLIRAVEPMNESDESGESASSQLLSLNRHGIQGIQRTNGPAKLCQALAIDRSLNGHDMRLSPLLLSINPALPMTAISKVPRIGISRATDKLWRFYISGNPYVSRS